MAEAAKNEFKETLENQKKYNERCAEEEREHELLMRQIREDKKLTVDLVKTFKEKHTMNIEERRPFDVKISENSRTGQLLMGNFDNTVQTRTRDKLGVSR